MGLVSLKMFVVMDAHNSVHLADASLIDMIVSPELSALRQRRLSRIWRYGVLVAGIVNCPVPEAFGILLGLTTKFENSSSGMIIINLIRSSDGQITEVNLARRPTGYIPTPANANFALGVMRCVAS